MLDDEREENYLRTGRPLTARQLRRLNHKSGSRKTHDHDRESVPEGQKFRCTTCAPLPFTQPVTLKAAEGPRDWSPS